MSKRISGAKRLQVIQNWLNGRDDDEWEVFPTKTEGKYFVKPRKQHHDVTPQDEPSATPQDDSLATPQVDSSATLQVDSLATPKVVPVASSMSTPKVVPVAPSMSTPQVDSSATIHKQSNYDPTINIEILNQLKLLGEEMRNNTKRDRKATKRMIKNVVKRQIGKPRTPFNDYSQEPVSQSKSSFNDYSQEPNPVSQPRPQMRRNNIFADVV